ncbi:MAG: glycosyl transferase [Tannerella sp.]|jgi:glycosyltransferase involved in cell wall biosynthesis|nr:glycosyl transferase [Tannerella sp.]
MKRKFTMVTPDYIFESSWEVCNKVGGIYTVLSSKARTLKDKFNDNIIFIGPDLGNGHDDFKEDESLFGDWKKTLPSAIKVRTGRWLVPGEPVAMLVSYKALFDERDVFYYDMWQTYLVDSSQSYGDYDESCIFAYSVGLTIESFYGFYGLAGKNVAALFNEWMLCMGALYLQKHVPAIATLFTTHATTVGRSIAGNNKPLYAYLREYSGYRMAKELHVEAKHSLENRTAKHVDCFTTVSEITARECRQLLDKAPDIVTPNGFEKGLVPEGEEYAKKRSEARKKLIATVEKLTGHKVSPDAFLVMTSGRYEYRNKGLDVFIDAMNELRKSNRLKRDTVAFIMVPAWVHGARADLKYVIDNDCETVEPMQTPFITHWINNMEDDKVMNYILSSGFTNSEADKLRIVFVPCYLDCSDGIFDKSYYDLLPGMDATVFDSYYEPWGYTPLESIAFGVPTVTTDLAGFGLWAKDSVSGRDIRDGVAVIKRTDNNYFDVVNKTATCLIDLINYRGDEEAIRQRCFNISSKAEWSKFITHYYAAFDIAFNNARKRIKIANI